MEGEKRSLFLKRISLYNFRNYNELRLELAGDIIGLVGKNGSGKTNLLDAIHYLAFTKSFLQSTDGANVRTGETAFSLKGHFEREGVEHEVFCAYQAGAKKVVKEDGAEYNKLSAHIGKYPLVLIAPNDIELIWDGGEVRRKFMDELISQVNRAYLEHLISYSNYLKMRNATLRQFAERGRVDHDLLDTYDRALHTAADFIFSTRQQFTAMLQPILLKYYQFLSENTAEKTDLVYRSDLAQQPAIDLLKANRQRDVVMQRTTAGIHRDDFVFMLNDQELKRYGSQGQQKSYLIGLKLAEFEMIAEAKQFKPLLLLDDIFDKLDDDRIARLIELMSARTFGQIFITDARPDRTRQIMQRAHLQAALLTISEGTVAADRVAGTL